MKIYLSTFQICILFLSKYTFFGFVSFVHILTHKLFFILAFAKPAMKNFFRDKIKSLLLYSKRLNQHIFKET